MIIVDIIFIIIIIIINIIVFIVIDIVAITGIIIVIVILFIISSPSYSYKKNMNRILPHVSMTASTSYSLNVNNNASSQAVK